MFPSPSQSPAPFSPVRLPLLRHLFQPLRNRRHKTFMIYSIRWVDILFTSTSYSYSFSLESRYYTDIQKTSSKHNKSKQHEERIGTSIVKYLVYPNGKTMIFVACSNNPLKLEDESDFVIDYCI
jgi:hypothetical protein